jgi:hypothetical protein
MTTPIPVCGFCRARTGKDGRPLLFCSRCHAVRYCDVACQRQDWRQGHRNNCNRVLTPFDAEEIKGPFRLEEIRFALFHMANDIPAGPDGFPVLFYKTFFDHLGPKLLSVLEEMFFEGAPGESSAARQLIPLPKAKKLISLRNSLKALKASASKEAPTVPLEELLEKKLELESLPPKSDVFEPSTIKSRPAIARQLRALSLHPEVDYIVFGTSGQDVGVVVQNTDARLLLRVNWNHAVFVRCEDLLPHVCLLFNQLRGASSRHDGLK